MNHIFLMKIYRVKSPTALDVFWQTPSLISCTGVIGEMETASLCKKYLIHVRPVCACICESCCVWYKCTYM